MNENDALKGGEINMMKDGNSISDAEQNKRGCGGCDHYNVIPEQLIEYCDMPGKECTYGE